MPSSTANEAHVLIVEDESNLRELYHAWVEQHYDVVSVSTGKEAITKIVDGTTTFDVILLDRHLPDISAETIIEESRIHQPNSQIGIVSAVRPETDIIELDIDSYLHKPVEEPEVLSLVDRLVDRSQYNERLNDYYAKADKLATLQQYNDKEELESNERYNALVDDLQIISQEMEELVDFTNNAEVEEILRDVLDRLNTGGETNDA